MTWYALVVVKLEERKIGYSAMRVHHGGMKLVQRIVAVVNLFAIYAEDGSTSHCLNRPIVSVLSDNNSREPRRRLGLAYSCADFQLVWTY